MEINNAFIKGIILNADKPGSATVRVTVTNCNIEGRIATEDEFVERISGIVGKRCKLVFEETK